MLKSFAVGVAAFLLGVVATKLNRVLLGPMWLLDDIVLSIFAGLIVLWYERLRIRDFRQRLMLAYQTNHQLQTLGYAALVQQDEHLGTIIRSAVERTDLILKEVQTETRTLTH